MDGHCPRNERHVRPNAFARNYTAAWCSQNAARVASFFAENGSLTINGGTPSVGRAAITAAAQEFMTAFPDMVVTMDNVTGEGGHVVYRWTLTGTNTGPGETPARPCASAAMRNGPSAPTA